MPYVEMTPDNVEAAVRKDYMTMMNDLKEVKRYQCPECMELLANEWNVTHHLLAHAIDRRITELWEQGRTLKEINDLYHMFSGMVEDKPEQDSSFLECHHNITKVSCFRIPHIHGCERPAYQVIEIKHNGKVKVGGIGSWSGYYATFVSLRCLRDPRPASEHYAYPIERRL